MTRTAFLAALEQLLAPLPEAERKDALSYYEDYLDAAGPENEARAIAELGSPEEVARKILDEQTPADSSAAPASPAPRSRWRMVLGGGLAVLVLVCFFFQHSKATPVQPVEPASSAVDSSSVPEESNGTHLAVPADTVPLTIPADDLGESTLQIPLEKLNQEPQPELRLCDLCHRPVPYLGQIRHLPVRQLPPFTRSTHHRRGRPHYPDL